MKICPVNPTKNYISNNILFFVTNKICFTQFLLVLFVMETLDNYVIGNLKINYCFCFIAEKQSMALKYKIT